MTKWIFGIVVVAVGAFITAKLTGVLNNVWDRAFPETPITVNVANLTGCPLVFNAPVEDVQRALDSDHGSEIDLRRAGGIDGDTSTVEITVQGKTDKVVNLTGMRVLIDEHAQPAGGISMIGCGGLQDVRIFAADLDQSTSSAVTAVPQPGRDNSGAPIPPADFPLRVSASDPEVFDLIVSTKTCDCTWRIELSWTVGGRSGTRTVDDHGKPFRTIGTGTGVYRRAYMDTDSRQVVLVGPDGLPLK